MIELLALGNSIAIAGHNVIATGASRRVAARTVLLLSASTSLVVVFLLAAFSAGRAQPADLAWGAAAGLAGGCALPVAYRSMALGPVAVSVPVTVLISTSMLVVVGAIQSGIGATTVVGLTCCLTAVLLATRQDTSTRSPKRTAALAVLAGVGFGGFSLCLSQVTPDTGLWPLVATRVMVALVAGMLVARHLPMAWSEVHGPGIAIMGAACGALDAAANLLLFSALASGSLVTIGVIASTSPVFAGLLAWRFLDEPLGRSQVLGLALTVLGLVLLAL